MSTKREIAAAIECYIRAHTPLKTEDEIELLDIIMMCLRSETTNHPAKKTPRRKQVETGIDHLDLRFGLLRRGYSLHRWALDNGFKLCTVHQAIRGNRNGPISQKIVRKIKKEIGR